MRMKGTYTALALCLFAGCQCYRWQGGVVDSLLFSERPQKSLWITDLSFEADVGIDTSGFGGPWNDLKKQGVASYAADVMAALPEVYSTNAGSEQISVVVKVMKNDSYFNFGKFIISLGFIWPEEMKELREYEVYVVRNGVRSKPVLLRTVEEMWMGEPWTLAVHFSYPDRDERLSENIAGRAGSSSGRAYSEELPRVKMKALAKAILLAAQTK